MQVFVLTLGFDLIHSGQTTVHIKSTTDPEGIDFR